VAEPLAYLDEFRNFKPDAVRKIFSTNLKGLLEGRPNQTRPNKGAAF